MSNEATLFTVVHTDPETEEEIIFGEVILDAEKKLSIASEEEGYEEFLANLVGSLNYQTVIGVKTSGPGRYSLASEDYRRSDPGFEDALKQHLQQIYGIELRSSKDFANHPEDFQDLGA